MNSFLKALTALALSAASNFKSVADAQVAVADDYVGGFRLRMNWEDGYGWQESNSERFWCMECEGNCGEGDEIRIDNCNSSKEQRFIFGAKTIHPSVNPSLCLTAKGVGSGNPLKLRSCNNSSEQNFNGLNKHGRFELQPEDLKNRCISQKHHPKAKEPVYPETCDKSRASDTTYWITF